MKLDLAAPPMRVGRHRDRDVNGSDDDG